MTKILQHMYAIISGCLLPFFAPAAKTANHVQEQLRMRDEDQSTLKATIESSPYSNKEALGLQAFNAEHTVVLCDCRSIVKHR